MDDKLIKAVSLIKSSKYRYKIMISIGDGIKLPSEISKDVNIRLNHVSAVLNDLKINGLVKCLNEKAKKGRLYKLTKLGKDAIKTINNGKY
jgi:predicted transcriptional regulator